MDFLIPYMDKAENAWLSLIRYKYFDTPDGQDCSKKIYYTTKSATTIGLVYSTFNTIAVEFQPTIQHGFVRICSLTWPFAFAGILYGSTVCISYKIRKTDDVLNHFFGGLSTGIAIYYKFKKPAYGWGYGIFIALGASLYKGLEMTGNRNKSFSEALKSHEKYRSTTPWGTTLNWSVAFKHTLPSSMYSGLLQKPTPPLLYTTTPNEMKSLYAK